MSTPNVHYLVTLPVANDLPSLTTVTAQVEAPDSEQALSLAIVAATSLGWIIDYSRGASVGLD